jgi:hypothetical protein
VGSGRWLTLAIGLGSWRSRFVLSFNLPFDINFNVFPFPPSKSKLIGDVLMKRQNAATWYIVFFSLLQLSLPIDATNHPALLGDARRTEKKSAKSNLEIIHAANSDRVAYWSKEHCCVNILAQEYPSLMLI